MSTTTDPTSIVATMPVVNSIEGDNWAEEAYEAWTAAAKAEGLVIEAADTETVAHNGKTVGLVRIGGYWYRTEVPDDGRRIVRAYPATRYRIRVSTGAEINKPGQFALYLVVSEDGEDGFIDGAAGVLTGEDDTALLAQMDDERNLHGMGAPTAEMVELVQTAIDTACREHILGPIPDGGWTIDLDGVPDHNGNVVDNEYGGYTIAELVA